MLVTDLGTKILNVVLFVLLMVYLFAFLLYRMLHSSGRVQVVNILEFFILMIIAFGLIIPDFASILQMREVSQIVGCALWLRGVSGLVRGYCVNREGKKYFPFWMFAIHIVLVTLGTYLYAKPIVRNDTVVMILAICCFVGAAAALCLIAFFPPKKRSRARRS